MNYVYAHYTTNDLDVPFYIGRGKGNRAYVKRKGLRGRSTEWCNIVESNGLVVKILYDNLTKEESMRLEKEQIAKWGRLDIGTGSLINKSSGGEGSSVISDEARKKISDTHKGKPKTDEHRRKISESQRGKKHPHKKHKPMSDVHKSKLSAFQKSRPMVLCPICNKLYNYINAKRWHFDKCKSSE